MTDARHPSILAGCIRELAERLHTKLPDSYSVERILQLCDELDRSLIEYQFTASLAVDADALGSSGTRRRRNE